MRRLSFDKRTHQKIDSRTRYQMKSVQRFSGRVAVVTGGASGIGAAIVTQLLAEGASVVIGDIDPARAAELIGQNGAERLAFQRCDVKAGTDLEALIKLAEEKFGGLDLMFNNAGTGVVPARVTEADPADWHRVMAVNVDSVFYGCRHAVPALRRRGGGAIVNTASICGLGGDPGLFAYNASKGAVINYTRTLALDHARENIRVNAICPGFISTPLTAHIEQTPLGPVWKESIPMGRFGKASEIAEAALFLASDAASYVTGTTLIADGGLMAYTGQPNLLAAMQAAGSTI